MSIDQNTISYGDSRRQWHGDFVDYMKRIIAHSNYAGMPAAIDDEGQIRWNAPSNRPPGTKHEHLRQERLEWWREKARSLGISQEGAWISEVARKIHPFGEKPCQTCGRILSIEYIYPTRKLIAAINRILPPESALSYEELDDIYLVVDYFIDQSGEEAYSLLTSIFPALNGVPHDKEEFKRAIKDKIVSMRPRGLLSPGVMSNAPDRLDGFHTYNLCCRKSQDKGRAADNLRLYTDDRRAFEQWVEGDWAAANVLMSHVPVGTCPSCRLVMELTADHIGPISLGFLHRPKFFAVCRSCNSSRNNRMSYLDIQHLIAEERAGAQVVSWQVSSLWNKTKSKVLSNDDALRLSKYLRINQHYYLMLLHSIYLLGFPDALLPLLHPEYARDSVRFVGLAQDSFDFDYIDRQQRSESYYQSKSIRLTRIAFDALNDYAIRESRNIHVIIPKDVLAPAYQSLLDSLASMSTFHSEFREALLAALSLERSSLLREKMIRSAMASAPDDFDYTNLSISAIHSYMALVGDWLAEAFLSGSSTRFDREAFIQLSDFGNKLLGSDESPH